MTTAAMPSAATQTTKLTILYFAWLRERTGMGGVSRVDSSP